MFGKKKKFLTKKYLMEKYGVYDGNFICLSKKSFEGYLNILEEDLTNFDYKKDPRYILLGKHKQIIKEMSKLYSTKEEAQALGIPGCPTKWYFNSLMELIITRNILDDRDCELLPFTNETYQFRTKPECKRMYDAYVKEGIVSQQEVDVIIHAIWMLRDSLDKCNENMEWF